MAAVKCLRFNIVSGTRVHSTVVKAYFAFSQQNVIYVSLVLHQPRFQVLLTNVNIAGSTDCLSCRIIYSKCPGSFWSPNCCRIWMSRLLRTLQTEVGLLAVMDNAQRGWPFLAQDFVCTAAIELSLNKYETETSKTQREMRWTVKVSRRSVNSSFSFSSKRTATCSNDKYRLPCTASKQKLTLKSIYCTYIITSLLSINSMYRPPRSW